MMRMGIPTVTVTASMFPPSTAGLLDSRVYGVSPIELPSAAPRESCATTPRFEEALRHDGGPRDQRCTSVQAVCGPKQEATGNQQ